MRKNNKIKVSTELYTKASEVLDEAELQVKEPDAASASEAIDSNTLSSFPAKSKDSSDDI